MSENSLKPADDAGNREKINSGTAVAIIFLSVDSTTPMPALWVRVCRPWFEGDADIWIAHRVEQWPNKPSAAGSNPVPAYCFNKSSLSPEE